MEIKTSSKINMQLMAGYEENCDKKWVAVEDVIKFTDDPGRDPEGTLILLRRELLTSNSTKSPEDKQKRRVE